MNVVVMGVTGSGKSSIGRRLAQALHVPFIEGDDFHAPLSVERMRRNEPLTDEDRGPWLAQLNGELRRHDESGAVLACSALTAASRRRLARGVSALRFVYLRADEDVLRARLQVRHGHFAGSGLLASQLDTLEEPLDAVLVDGNGTADEVVRGALAGLVG